MPDTITVTLDESQRQAVLLALASLSLERPGWLFMLQEIADAFGGIDAQVLFKEFRRLNADRIRPPSLDAVGIPGGKVTTQR